MSSLSAYIGGLIAPGSSAVLSALDPSDSNIVNPDGSSTGTLPQSITDISPFQVGAQGGTGNTNGSYIAPSFLNNLEAGLGDLLGNEPQGANDAGAVIGSTAGGLVGGTVAGVGQGISAATGINPQVLKLAFYGAVALVALWAIQKYT